MSGIELYADGEECRKEALCAHGKRVLFGSQLFELTRPFSYFLAHFARLVKILSLTSNTWERTSISVQNLCFVLFMRDSWHNNYLFIDDEITKTLLCTFYCRLFYMPKYVCGPCTLITISFNAQVFKSLNGKQGAKKINYVKLIINH